MKKMTAMNGMMMGKKKVTKKAKKKALPFSSQNKATKKASSKFNKTKFSDLPY